MKALYTLVIYNIFIISAIGAVRPIVDLPYDQSYPVIWKDNIVYTDTRGWPNRRQDIYLFNLSTKTETLISSNPSYQTDPQIWGELVFYIDNNNGNFDVCMYDISNGMRSQLTDNPANEMNLSVFENVIVYDSVRNGDSDIYMYEVLSGMETKITTHPANQFSPHIWKNRIVYVDDRNGNKDIYMFDVSTGIETQITDQLSDQYEPKIWGDKIVYSSSNETTLNPINQAIYIYDITTGTETLVSKDRSYSARPSIWKNNIVYESMKDNNIDIYMYSMTNGIESRITTHTAAQYAPSIWENKIAWFDWRNLQHTGSDIYLYELEPGNIEISLDSIDINYDNSLDMSKNPIWSIATPNVVKPICDSIRTRYSSYVAPGSYDVEINIHSLQGKPSWSPKARYSWYISETNMSKSGNLFLNESAEGWTGKIRINMPDKVGRYIFHIGISIYDDNDVMLETRTTKFALYATYDRPIVPVPIWDEDLMKAAVGWSKGANTEEQVASLITNNIYASKWLYEDRPSPLSPNSFSTKRCSANKQFGGWPNFFYEPDRLCGNCVDFAETWIGLTALLGVEGETITLRNPYPTSNIGGLGFVTVTNTVALDGQKGNAHKQHQEADRWYFTMHQIVKPSNPSINKYYDPTFGKEYSSKRQFIEWYQIGNFENSGFNWAAVEEGHLIRLILLDANYGWGDLEYRSPYKPEDKTANRGADFSGHYTTEAIDTDGDSVFNFLRVDSQINIMNSGKYSIVGNLMTESGNFITNRSTHKSQTLSSTSINATGLRSETATLIFSGEDIFKSNFDGIFTVDLSIIDENGFIIANQRYRTDFYRHTEFGEIPIRIDKLSDYGKDENKDGQYENLTVEVDLNVLKPSNYVINGTIYSHDADIISKAMVVKKIDKDDTIELDFNGFDIRKSKENGPYDIFITLSNEDGIQFKKMRYQSSYYEYRTFLQPTVNFTGTYSESGIDIDNNGLFEYFAVQIEIEAITSGFIEVEAILHDKNGNSIDNAFFSAFLESGHHAASLKFDGTLINRNGIPGPFYVENIVFRKGTNIELLENSLQTSAYDLSDFEKQSYSPIAVTGKYKDFCEDIDDDNLNDTLNIAIEVTTDRSGECVLTARLVDVNEQQIDWSEVTEFVDAGTRHSIQLQFDGESIYNNKQNGPYFVKDVLIFHTDDPTFPTYIKDAYTTDYYNYIDFGNGDNIYNDSDTEPERDSGGGGIGCFIQVSL